MQWYTKALLYISTCLLSASCLEKPAPWVPPDTYKPDSSIELRADNYDSKPKDTPYLPDIREAYDIRDAYDTIDDIFKLDIPDVSKDIKETLTDVLLDKKEADDTKDTHVAEISDIVKEVLLVDAPSEVLDVLSDKKEAVDVINDNCVVEISDVLQKEVLSDASDKDVTQEVKPNPCYTNDFNLQTDQNVVVFQSGNWSWNFVDGNGYLYQSDQNKGNWKIAYLNTEEFTDFNAKMKVRMLNQTPQTGVDSNTALLFRYNPSNQSGYSLKFWMIKGDGYPFSPEVGFQLGVESFDKGLLQSTILKGNPYNEWQEVGVNALGQNIAVYWNGAKIFSFNDPLFTSGKIGFATYNAQTEFDDLEICPPVEESTPALVPYQPDDHTVVLLHFDNPNPMKCEGTITDKAIDSGSTEVPSLENFGQARHFNGAIDGTSAVYVLWDSKLDIKSGLTIEALVKPDLPENSYTGGSANIVTKALGGGEKLEGYFLGFGPTWIGASLGTDNGTWHGIYVNNYPLPTDKFTHLAMTYDGSYMRFYINKELKAKVACTGEVYYSLLAPLYIGNLVGGTNNAFIGTIDEVRISNVAREF